jgi:hypothetical protein
MSNNHKRNNGNGNGNGKANFVKVIERPNIVPPTNVIWNSGNAVQYGAARPKLMLKFQEQGVLHRIQANVVFNIPEPSIAVDVDDALQQLLHSRDVIHDRVRVHCEQGFADGFITQEEQRKEIWLSQKNRIEQKAKIETEGLVDLQDKYLKKKEYWRKLRDQYD